MIFARRRWRAAATIGAAGGGGFADLRGADTIPAVAAVLPVAVVDTHALAGAVAGVGAEEARDFHLSRAFAIRVHQRGDLLARGLARELQELIGNPPGWLQEWSGQIGAELRDGLRENPGWIAFARENGTVYHTYTVMAPDPFVAPYFNFLLERTPKVQPAEPRSWRKDEYPD